MIRNIHLTLSDKCGANCIFCPKHETNVPLADMNFETAKRVIDEIASESFKSKHQLDEIQVGNNGDCFFNPELIKILRYIKEKGVTSKIIMFTNFQKFTPELQEVIVGERLVDAISCNIDSMSKDYYAFIKRLDLENTLKNIASFNDVRKKFKADIPMTIYIINIYRYIKIFKHLFKQLPAKVKNEAIVEELKDDYDFTNQALLRIIRRARGDKVENISPIFWAERQAMKNVIIDYKDAFCPHIKEFGASMFINTKGDVYLCCLDDKYNLTYGNIYESTLDELSVCDKKLKMIDQLLHQDFEGIGYPCTAVPFCQIFSLKNEEEMK